MFSLIAAFFPPDLSLHYLIALVVPVVESVGMTLGAMVLAYAFSLLAGLYIGARFPGALLLQAMLSNIRSIPDLTLAIFTVICFGIGPAAGMVALAIFYGAAVAKIFGDLCLTADNGPLEALRAAGASRTQVALFGLLPLKARDMITYGSYEFESAVRASVIVGAVGGGGLGTELVGTLNAFDFHRTATLLLVLIVLVAAIDQTTLQLRRRPKALLLFIPPAFYAAWFFGPHSVSVAHALHTLAGMFPPQLDTAALATIPRLLAETIAMAVFGTVLGAAIALPLGLLSARNVVPGLMAVPFRRFLEALRAVPEVVWGLILVATVGIGPTAGVFALGLHSGGCLGRLFAESLENVRAGPVAAVQATGASALAVAGYATVPLAFGPLAIHTLFRLEWNLRQATVVGMIGAGGLGQGLFEAQQLFFYQRMMAFLLITSAVVLLVDRVSALTRQRLGWTITSPEQVLA